MRLHAATARGILLGVVLGLLACGSGGEMERTAEGVVVRVEPARAQITIEHGDIPGMMKAMTMSFAVQEPSELEGLEAGDEIRFRVRYAEGRYSVSGIEAR